jgi:SAM-dependent methyltransferase
MPECQYDRDCVCYAPECRIPGPCPAKKPDGTPNYLDISEFKKDAELMDMLFHGRLTEAKTRCREMGLITVLDALNESTRFCDSLHSYEKWYKQANGRQPGDQILKGWVDPRQEEVKAHITRLDKHDSLLDIGCSDGSFLIDLCRKGIIKSGWGVDPFEEGINFARKYARDNGYDLAFGCGVFESMFVPGRFDVIYFGEILEHVLDPLKVIQKAKGSMAENGAFIVTVPVGYPPPDDLAIRRLFSTETKEHIRYLSEKDVASLFEKIGYRVDYKTTNGHSWVNLVVTLKAS